MPFNVAMELPDSGVITAETDNRMPISIDEDGIASCGDLGKFGALGWIPVTSVFFGAGEDLEFVAVHVEWVLDTS